MGRDLDPSAVEITQANAPNAAVDVGDARTLDLSDEFVSACVSNLPFGRQHVVAGSAADWLQAVLGEFTRVTRAGGRVVVLTPTLPKSAIPRRLQLTGRYPITLLGTKTTIWALDRGRADETVPG